MLNKNKAIVQYEYNSLMVHNPFHNEELNIRSCCFFQFRLVDVIIIQRLIVVISRLGKR